MEETKWKLSIVLQSQLCNFSFSIIDGRISELKKIDTKTSKLLNMQKMLHPKADVERLYIPRKDGGRGLIECRNSIQNSNNRT